MLVQSGNNWIQKIPLTAKLDSAYGLVQFWLSSEFFSSNYFQIGQHVVLLHILIHMHISIVKSISILKKKEGEDNEGDNEEEEEEGRPFGPSVKSRLHCINFTISVLRDKGIITSVFDLLRLNLIHHEQFFCTLIAALAPLRGPPFRLLKVARIRQKD